MTLPALAAFALLGASCSQQVRPVKKTARPPVYVGKVEQVYPSHNYVLIALAGNVYEPGTVLISQSPGREENRRVANLIVTEERMGRARIPADIRSGAVEAGDLVFLYRNLAAPESSGKKDNPDPDNPEPGTDEDGKEFSFEVIDAADYNDERYLAVVPYAEDSTEQLEEDANLIIMRVGEEDGEEYLDVVDDDEELYEVSDMFARRLEELYDIDLNGGQ